MPELRRTRHHNLQRISNTYSIFGPRLSDGNCQADSQQAPFDATFQVTADDIDMERVTR